MKYINQPQNASRKNWQSGTVIHFQMLRGLTQILATLKRCPAHGANAEHISKCLMTKNLLLIWQYNHLHLSGFLFVCKPGARGDKC